MRVFDFDHAIVRRPGRSVVIGIRKGSDAPTYEGVVAEHAPMSSALRAAGSHGRRAAAARGVSR